MIFARRAGIGTQCGHLDHATHSSNNASVEQGTGCAHMYRIECLQACLAYDADSIDQEVDSAQSWNPVADAEILGEISEDKLCAQNCGSSPARGNYGVTSAVQGLKEMSAYETGGAGQQDAHAWAGGS
jgi:hypothetical protein